MLNLGKEVQESEKDAIVLTVALVMAAMMAVSQAAWAQDTPVGPTSNEHNAEHICGGTTSFNTIESLGGAGLGTLVSGLASLGEDIPSETHANCDTTGP